MGHLFVLQGDLRRVACEALLIPCDGRWDVNNVWQEVLPEERVSQGRAGRLRLDVNGVDTSGGWALLPPSTAERRRVAVVQTVGDQVDVNWMAEQVTRAVTGLARKIRADHRVEGRPRPLIALPLAGTGQGGLHGHRGHVIERLVPSLVDAAASTGVDVALVLATRRDFAAVQGRRQPSQWPELTQEHVAHAGHLGALAARGELSLFLGSGVSVPLGLPTWRGLLELLAERAGRDRPQKVDSVEAFQAEAEQLVSVLGDDYRACMTELFDLQRHSLSHGLLANLRVQRSVTTNYDNAMELALEAVLPHDELKVMPRYLVEGSKPWLLKLHGDIKKPDTLVLTTSDYRALMKQHNALLGTVQGLLLTSHLLFVGFSLVDEDFVELAKDVQRIRALASGEGSAHRAGTVVALHPDAVEHKSWSKDLTLVAMSDHGNDAEAARLLEVFLDRVAWEAAREGGVTHQYLLDPAYEASVTDPRAMALREALLGFARSLPTKVQDSGTTGWSIVEKALRDLGHGH